MPTGLEYTTAVKPLIVEHKTNYNYDVWINDVVSSSLNYSKNEPYFEGIENNATHFPLITIIIIILVALVSFLYSFYRRRLALLFKTFFNWKVAKQIIRYERVYSHPVNVLLFIVFLVSTPLFYSLSYQAIEESPEIKIINLALVIAFFTISYLLFKFLLYKLSAWLFEINNLIEEYIFQTNLFTKFFGVINLMLIILLLFSPVNKLLIIGISLSALFIFLVIQLIRGVLIGSQKVIPLQLIILYLCTFEILPWLIIGKWVKNLL